MQKKLIALAVAGLVSAPVFAQSNVTIYGIVDAYVGHASGGGDTFTGVNGGGLSGSRLGFKGTEDLGNGLKALFTLEYSLANDTNAGVGNTGGLNARQQIVGLQGGFGFLGLGRQYAPGFHSWKYDVTAAASPYSPHSIATVAIGASITPNSPARVNNSIAYSSPSFGGVKVDAIYGFGETNQGRANRENDYRAIAATYANGPLAVGVIYHNIRVDSATTVAGVPTANASVSPALTGDNNLGVQREWLVGASYDFGVVKAAGSYQKLDTTEQGLDVADAKVWQLGVAAPVGKGEVQLAFGRADVNKRFNAKVDNGNTDIWTLAYVHPLSKRTNTYAAFTRTNNESGAAVNNLATPNKTSAPAITGEDINSVVVGVRHVF